MIDYSREVESRDLRTEKYALQGGKLQIALCLTDFEIRLHIGLCILFSCRCVISKFVFIFFIEFYNIYKRLELSLLFVDFSFCQYLFIHLFNIKSVR